MRVPAPEPLDLPNGDAVFYSAFFGREDADRLLRELLATTVWRQDSTTIYGRHVDLPRLTAWYGDEGTGYRYSGIDNDPLPWTPSLLEVRRAIVHRAGAATQWID